MTMHAVVGTGYWGSNHVRVAAELAEEGVIEEFVLCDLPDSGVAEMAEDYGIEYVNDFQALADLGVDTATIATPSTTHHEIATDLLAAGVDCLVEKPIALTSEDAWDIVDTSDEYGRTLAVGHIFRHHPALRDLKRRIDRGEFGKIKYIVTNRLTFRAPRTTTGVLYSLAVHDVDIYNMLLDDTPDHLYCRLDSFLRDGIDESATIVTGYGDTTGVINESWQLPMFGKRRDLGIVGTRRAAYIDYLEDTELEIYDAKVVKEQGVMQAVEEGSTTVEVEGYEPLKQEVEDFVAASESGEEPVASGRIGAETVELLEIAKESADAGDTMDLS
jgi:predicted dehydrogenase